MVNLISSLAACFLSFIAASLSSAGGVGGGSLYLSILNLVARLDLKTASTFSAFMVTGGSLSNVLYSLTSTSSAKSSIDYDIVLLSEPCMLLGVSAGVLGNVMFPEWLITVLFALCLSFSTYKTCGAGFRCWRVESRAAVVGVGDEKGSAEEALLLFSGDAVGIPWRNVGGLLMVWLCFFGLHLLIADQVTAATTSFMVLFSSSMSMGQYLILGMKHVEQALVFAGVCFVASIIGLVLIQRAIEKSGRVSLIVFSVSVVMALSTISITSFGAIDVWREYKSGDNLGFNLPC